MPQAFKLLSSKLERCNSQNIEAPILFSAVKLNYCKNKDIVIEVYSLNAMLAALQALSAKCINVNGKLPPDNTPLVSKGLFTASCLLHLSQAEMRPNVGCSVLFCISQSHTLCILVTQERRESPQHCLSNVS